MKTGFPALPKEQLQDPLKALDFPNKRIVPLCV